MATDRVLNCLDCNKPLNNYYAKRCKSCSKKGELHYNWKGGRRLRQGWYVEIYSPEHPNCSKEGYVLEHRLVMEKKIGRYLKSFEVVHHIDGNKSNNKISNLMLFPNKSAHHNFRHIGESKFICKHCGKNQKDK